VSDTLGYFHFGVAAWMWRASISAQQLGSLRTCLAAFLSTLAVVKRIMLHSTLRSMTLALHWPCTHGCCSSCAALGRRRGSFSCHSTGQNACFSWQAQLAPVTSALQVE
jgi:hypothetical protein